MGWGDGVYGRLAGRRAEVIGDGSRDAVKGRPAKVFGFQRINVPNFGFEVACLSTVPPSITLHIIQKNPNSNIPESPHSAGPDVKKDLELLPHSHHISLGVPDYDGFVKSLKEKGIPIYEKTPQEGKIKQVFFCDPDGNGLEVDNWPRRQ